MRIFIKKLVKYLDSRVFHGRVRTLYSTYTIKKKKQFFRHKRTAVIMEPVTDMILMQTNTSDYLQYQGYDLAVRYLAICEYYGQNDIGFSLYKKMHTMGGNYGEVNKTEEYYEKERKRKRTVKYGAVREEHSIEQFSRLIDSYESNGYKADSLVMADKNLLSMNGSHRIALAIYREQEFINTEIHDLVFSRRFSLNWFWQMGFSLKEIHLISDTMNTIIAKSKAMIGNFYCILFPPAYKFFDEIMADIGAFEPSNIQCLGYEDIKLEEADFVGFLRLIYSFDSISAKNLERKLFYILRASTKCTGLLPIRILTLKIQEPMYRLKYDNGLPESLATVRLKEAIRGRYKVRDKKFSKHYVGDYAHDVIIHSTDNYISNKALGVLLNLDRDISELFQTLEQYNYCLLESSVDKLGSNFPKSFLYNEDIDILITDNELEKITTVIEEYCKRKYSLPWIHIEKNSSTNGRRVRVMLCDSMIVMFDLMTKLPGLKSEYVDVMIGRSIEAGFKHLCIQDEIAVRLCKYAETPSKKWHARFIVEHEKDYGDLDYNVFVNSGKIKRLYDGIIASSR